MKYFEALREAGARQIKDEVEFPDFRLGIERAENLNHVPIHANYMVAVRRPVMQYDYEQSYEKMAYNGVADGVNDDTFQTESEAGSLWAAIEAGRAASGY